MKKRGTHFFKELKRGLALMLAGSILVLSAVSCQSDAKAPEAETPPILESRQEASLKAFLLRFVRGYAVSADGKWQYDSSSPSKNGVNLLTCIVTPASCADWTLYSDVPEEECFIEKSDDPRGWSVDTHAYYRYDVKTVDFIAGKVFNLSKKNITKLVSAGESEFFFYKESKYYYAICEDPVDSYAEVSLISIGFDGKRYYVKFDADKLQKTDDSNEYVHIAGRCSAELALRTLDGKEYWSLYQFSSD